MSNMNHFNQPNNEEPKKNGLQMMGDAGKHAVKRLGKKAVQKLAKVALKAALKKLATGVLLKTAPIWGSVLALILICVIILALLTPDFSSNTYANSNEEVDKKVQEYISLGTHIGFNPQWIVAMEMVLYENENLLDYDTDLSAYHFFSVYYEKYVPEQTICIATDPITGACTSTYTIPEHVVESGTYRGKNEIMYLFEMKGQPKDDIIAALQGIRAMEYVRLRTTVLDLEFAFSDAKLNQEQQEYFNDILESGLIVEEFPQLASFTNGFGGGAYCSPDKQVNQSQWDAAFVNAGVLSSYGSAIMEKSQRYGIDPVVFAAIAFQESTYGTSKAIINKNNPGGLMGSDGLMRFSSLDEGLESMARTLHNRIIKDGLITIERLGSVYAPVGAENDPNGLNNHWVPNVSAIVAQLGGLTMNCEAYSNGMNIVFDGDVSQAAQTVATAGTKWIGNSVYVFGGGRNQSDIARGRFDCSSFVHWAFGQAGISLGPLSSTSTETLNKMGTRISMSEIQVGDIIFWDTYKKDGHVGIYIGNGKWMGAQDSTGVAIENLNNSYWQSHFSGHVRRILPNA